MRTQEELEAKAKENIPDHLYGEMMYPAEALTKSKRNCYIIGYKDALEDIRAKIMEKVDDFAYLNKYVWEDDEYLKERYPEQFILKTFLKEVQ